MAANGPAVVPVAKSTMSGLRVEVLLEPESDDVTANPTRASVPTRAEPAMHFPLRFMICACVVKMQEKCVSRGRRRRRRAESSGAFDVVQAGPSAGSPKILFL